MLGNNNVNIGKYLHSLGKRIGGAVHFCMNCKHLVMIAVTKFSKVDHNSGCEKWAAFERFYGILVFVL